MVLCFELFVLRSYIIDEIKLFDMLDHIKDLSVDWLQDSTSFGGHSRPKGGHRQVSGLVRASLKKETRRQILAELLLADKEEKVNASEE